MQPKLVDSREISLRPVAPGFEHLIPKLNTPVEATYFIKGIRATEANAIRRTILNELPALVLYFEYEDLHTDDAYPIVEMIQGVFMRLPIRQTAKEGDKFTLEVKNDTADPMRVKSSDIIGASKLVNPGFTLLVLNPGCFIKIKNITVVQSKGYRTIAKHMGWVACQAGIFPTRKDLQMYDRYIPLDPKVADPIEADAARGIRSAVSAETEYAIKFTTLGTMPPLDIIRAAIDNIIERLKLVGEMAAGHIERQGDENTLLLDDESLTIGTLLMRWGLDADFSSNLTARQLPSSRTVELRFRLGSEYTDGAKFISAATAKAIKYFTALAAEFA